ncbi:MAG: hypothetical protein C4550_00375 [Nitrospiraceae bacterium]|nr:MAG: hypothetical protein C4550_00375 [Nitrospiraceae bacterium]
MAYKIEFIPDAENDLENLDKSLKKEAGKKIDALSENPFPVPTIKSSNFIFSAQRNASADAPQRPE